MATQEIANRESVFIAVSKNPDICRVGGKLVPFDITSDLSGSVEHSPDVNARAAPVLFVGSVIQGVDGNRGEGISSGVSGREGFVIVKSGAGDVNVNGRAAARDLSACEMNVSVSGASNGTVGQVHTKEKKQKPSKPATPASHCPPAKAPGDYTEVSKPYRWADCRAAAQGMEAVKAQPGTWAVTNWTVTTKMKDELCVNSPQGGVDCFGTLTATAKKSTVTLPDWENIPDDPAVKSAWKKMVDALRKHEEGHVVIAREGAKRLNGVVVSSHGQTVTDAAKDRNKQIKRLLDGINEAQEAYDDAVQHGVKQDVCGGEVPKLVCPVPPAPAASAAPPVPPVPPVPPPR